MDPESASPSETEVSGIQRKPLIELIDQGGNFIEFGNSTVYKVLNLLVGSTFESPIKGIPIGDINLLKKALSGRENVLRVQGNARKGYSLKIGEGAQFKLRKTEDINLNIEEGYL